MIIEEREQKGLGHCTIVHQTVWEDTRHGMAFVRPLIEAIIRRKLLLPVKVSCGRNSSNDQE